WGGYWAWDPVENASFIPWLTATAFIHSVVVQERRGMLKVWNVALIILTYTLTIIGTFLVRSGIITSVHAFGDAGLVTPLVVFMITVFLGSLLLIVWRMPLLRPDRKLKSIVSREGVFLINNLILCLIALATLTMTLWPVITRFLFGEEGKHEFGQEAYVLVNLPLFLTLLVLTGIGPLLPYGKGSGRQVLRQMLFPLLLAGLAFALNAAILLGGGHTLQVVSEGTTIDYLVSLLRIATQYALPSICVLIVGSVIQEALLAGRLRQQSTKGSMIGAVAGAVFANRRRFGGYTCHIGLAIVAMGIYISSFYEIDTSAEIPVGGYALIGDSDEPLVFVADQVEDSSLYRDLQLRLYRERGAAMDPEVGQRLQELETVLMLS
ncbi:MAG: cytochrome c biogenesis protein CcsA, partial [Planctomycetes bacterium]|nr:cytochrome c biogenesis protein CcsA [Planctomycetota bacterium]